MASSRKSGESKKYSLSQPQVQALLKACRDLEERVTIGLQLFLGLRIGEVAHLNSSWITQEGNLKVPLKMSCNCAECMRVRDGLWKPKTKAGARTLPIPQRMRKDISELLCIKPYGMEVSRTGLYYRTATILWRVKVKGASPETLRRTCSRMLKESGMEAESLAYFMGWESVFVEHKAKVKEQAAEQAREIFG